jgi:hypothetical protein
VHLLEKIRTKCKLLTNKLDTDFEQAFAKKIDVDLIVINELVQKINTIRNMDNLSSDQLISLYNSIQHINKYL